MNAEPLLHRIAKVLAEHRLKAIMIGNATSALHGAPVTTLDIDFMFRKTPTNLNKLKAVANDLRATILKPNYPVSDLFRVVNDEQGIQLDFMTRLHGIRSFEGMKSRATPIVFGEYRLLVASRADNEKVLAALKEKAQWTIADKIRRLLPLPMNKRTHFLRVRHPGGGSHL